MYRFSTNTIPSLLYKMAYLTSLFCISLSASAVNIRGFEQPEHLPEYELFLNGYGIRSKWLMNIYTAGLYLEKEQLQPSANWAVNADSPMALRLVVMRDNLASERMIAATRQGFAMSNGAQPLLEAELVQFLTLYKEQVHKGDIFTLIYLPQEGLQTLKNGQLISTIKSLSFKQAIFNMWLGERPIQNRLKENLLRRP